MQKLILTSTGFNNKKIEKKQKEITKMTADLALLSQNMLKGEELTKFITKSIELI